MNDPIFRFATEDDIDFITGAVIAAEKSGTDKLGYSTLFGLPESKVNEILREIILEDIEGQELCLSNFLLTIIDGRYAGTSSAWVEGECGKSSNRIKADILSWFIPQENFSRALPLLERFKEVNTPRSLGTLQIECVYSCPGFRNISASNRNILKQIELAKFRLPDLRIAQGHLSKSNEAYLRLISRIGFNKTGEGKVDDLDVFHYLPSDTRIIVEKDLG